MIISECGGSATDVLMTLAVMQDLSEQLDLGLSPAKSEHCVKQAAGSSGLRGPLSEAPLEKVT